MIFLNSIRKEQLGDNSGQNVKNSSQKNTTLVNFNAIATHNHIAGIMTTDK